MNWYDYDSAIATETTYNTCILIDIAYTMLAYIQQSLIDHSVLTFSHVTKGQKICNNHCCTYSIAAHYIYDDKIMLSSN